MTLTYRRAKGKRNSKDARQHVEPTKECNERVREREEGKSNALPWMGSGLVGILFVG
jgi:hypothetical protein